MSTIAMNATKSTTRARGMRLTPVVRELGQRLVLFPFLRLLCRPLRIEGAERLKALDEPAIIVANHASHFDAMLVLAALPSHVRRNVTVAAAADYFFKSRVRGWAVSTFLNAYPFERTGDGCAHSLDDAARRVRDGASLLIFPEGTRSPDGEIGRFRRGAGALATELGAPVVPVHIEGAFDLMRKGQCFPRRRPVTVRIGEPVRFGRSADAIAVANELRGRVGAL
jgi:long-chain acyl-CoA synthetase